MLNRSTAQSFISEKTENWAFPLLTAMHATSVYVVKNDDWLVHKATSLFQSNVTLQTPTLSSTSPSLQYDFYSYNTGAVNLNAHFSSALNFHNDSNSLQYAISIDNEKPEIISINKVDNNGRQWNPWGANDIIVKTTDHSMAKKGKHPVKFPDNQFYSYFTKNSS